MPLIRTMTEADLEATSQLAARLVELHHSWDTTRFFTTPDVARGYLKFFHTQVGQPGVLLLVAEVEGAVVGYLYGTREGRDWAKLLDPHGAIHDVFVAPEARRRGVARALLQEAAARFRAEGLGQVVLYSASSNVEGQALFKQLGYRPTMVEMTLDLEKPGSDR